MPNVNPKILRWARETAGISPDDAVSKLQLRDTRKGSALDRLAALESGAEAPTRPMLVRMAKAYRRPLLAFYLADVPSRGDRGEDFRALPFEPAVDEEAQLDALLRRVKASQRLVRAVLEDEDEAEPLPFVGSVTMRNGVATVARSIQATLNLSVGEFRAQRGPHEAFAFIRERAEEVGVFVMLVGDLGSHHTALDTHVFRGIALSDDVAPFVVINDNDSRAAWTFTLLHELAHLWLGQTGVSGGLPEAGIERFCNDVASRCLVSHEDVATLAREIGLKKGSLTEVLGEYARSWNVSRSLLAYRLYRAKHLPRREWQELHQQLAKQWQEDRDRTRTAARKGTGGPSYYQVRRHRLGPALVALTGRMLASGAISTTKASRILGVRPPHVGRLTEEALAGFRRR